MHSRFVRVPASLTTVTAAVVVIGIVAGVPGIGMHAPDSRGWPWFAGVALAYAVADAAPVRWEVRRHTLVVSLTEIPLVVGLATLDAPTLLVARLLGGVAVLLWRRRSVGKTAFNAVLFGAEVLVAVRILHLLAPGAGAQGAALWPASYTAVLAADLLGALAVSAAIIVLQGRMHVREVAQSAATVAVSWALVASLGQVVLLALQAEPRAAALLAGLFLVLAAAYLSYSRLLRRHRTLGQLTRFAVEVNGLRDVPELLSLLVDHTRRQLAAERAYAVLFAHGDRPAIAVGGPGDGPPERVEPDDLSAHPVVAAALARGSAVLVPRGGTPGTRELLAAAGARDALAVPLGRQGGITGAVLACDRLGDARTFTDEDQGLLEALAGSATVAVRNSELLDQLVHEAGHDRLTGLPTRTLFFRAVEAMLTPASAAARPGRPGPGPAPPRVGMLLFEVATLSDVNDTLGHELGDELVAEVAARLRGAAPPGTAIGRLDGGAFGLAVPLRSDDPPADEALAAARELARAVRRPLVLGRVPVAAGGTVGVAVAPDHGADPATLLRRADAALRAARLSGTPVRGYGPGLDRGNAARLSLAGELPAAVEAGQLVVHHQPKLRLDSREITGVEALVRWRHPRLGILGPDEFIPIAESTGMIGALTRVVLEQSLRQCRAWLDRGLRLSVAVNLSARALADPDLQRTVLTLLRGHGVDPDLLILEITESSVMTEPERALPVLAALRDSGVRISVDDFGTGYSSLAHLRRLPVDEVKIDKSFVRSLGSDEQDVAIVRAVLDLARSLRLTVVAEGVEDAAALSVLETLGCDAVQGYLISRPLPADELDAWLEARVAAGTALSATAPRDAHGAVRDARGRGPSAASAV